MTTIEQVSIYDELLNLLTETAALERLLSFRLPPDKQARLDMLLQQNRDGTLAEEQRGELDEYERLEHLGRMLKARLRRNSM
jgi:hypothetical protein